MDMFFPFGLLLLGFFLIWLEVWVIPGFNVVGISGLLAILFGTVLVFTSLGWLTGITSIGVTGSIGYSMFYLAQKAGVWNKFILQTSLPSGEQLQQLEGVERKQYLGKTGSVLTPLRPTGVIEIDGERLEVVTEGGFIAAGSRVRVVAMDRRRYFVRLDESAALPKSDL